MYLEDNQQFNNNLLRETKTSDIKAVRHLVHAIKRTSGNLGIVKVDELAKKIKEQLVSNETILITSAEKLINIVELSFKDTRRILEENSQVDNPH